MKIISQFEKVILITIITMMMLTILISTIELGVIIYQELLKPPKFLLNITNLMEIFGFFFMILIGLELLHTIKTYLIEDSVHVEVVILVAMIAIARKFIVLELKSMNSLTLIGLGTIILALAISYYLIKHIDRSKSADQQKSID
ncbi:phosphate-starvation-inducible PsiE family protein [candidate division KSB1 bacterium]|nr:phosphate-starvation-inducible PsiE family protein [candidate division KSB1 bacterium]